MTDEGCYTKYSFHAQLIKYSNSDSWMTTASIQPPAQPTSFWRAQTPIFLVAMGHGTLHWVTSILFILLPFIQSDLKLSYTEAGSLITIFHICATLANIPSGPLADIIGRRVLIMAGSLALCGGALVATGYAADYFMVAVMIGIIGAASMSWHPPAMSYLSIRYPDRRGFAVSIHGLGSSIMQAAGPAVAGIMMSTSTTVPFLALAMNWRETAIINGTFPLCIGIMMFMLLKRTRRSVKGRDISTKLKDYATGFKGVLKNRSVITLCAVSGFRKLTQAGIFVFLPLYLHNVLKLDALMIGATLMSLQIAGAIAGPIAGTMSDRIGRRKIVFAGMWATTIIVMVLPFIGNTTFFIVGVSFLGFSLYAVRPVLQSWIMDMSEQRMHGSVTSLMFGVESSFSVVIPLAGGVIADLYGLEVTFFLLGGGVIIANMLLPLVPKAEKASIS
ncbi:MFS transporter [bacterium]|nr:MFS transporter [bacterium]